MLQYRYFVKKTLKLTFVLIILLSVLSLSYFEFFQPYRFITWSSLVFFMFVTLISGYYNTRSVAKPFFINIFIGSLALKFILSLAFVIAYFFLFKPENKWFVIPFLLLFSFYKAFETLMLYKYSKEAAELSKGE